MSGFKKLNQSDVFLAPYTANKSWNFDFGCYPSSSNGIRVFKGTRLTGAFSSEEDPITEGLYERLVYDSINNQYYQAYTESITGSIPQFYTGSLAHNQTAPYYYDYNLDPQYITSFPTYSNAGIRVISIPKNIFGSELKPGTFYLSSSGYYITDDGHGNVFSGLTSSTFIGNVFYPQGLIVITDSSSQDIFPLPPIAKNDFAYFTASAANKTISVLSNDSARTGVLDTSSIKLVSGDSSSFTASSNGTITFNSTTPGTYQTYYTVEETYGASCRLTSNPAKVTAVVTPDPITYNDFFTAPVVTDFMSIVGDTGSNQWFVPVDSLIFPIYITTSTPTINVRIRLVDYLGHMPDYVSPGKVVTSGSLNYIQILKSTFDYTNHAQYYLEYQDSGSGWHTLNSSNRPSGTTAAGFFGTLGVSGSSITNINPMMTTPFLTASVAPESSDGAWRINNLASGSIIYTTTTSGVFINAGHPTPVTTQSIPIDGVNSTGSIFTFSGPTSSYNVDYYYTNDFRIITTSSSLNLYFGGIIQQIYGGSNTSFGRLFYRYRIAAVSLSYYWAVNTYTCEQDGAINIGSTVTGLSSPIAVTYDNTSSRAYFVDGDHVSGNFWKADPTNFTTAANATFISGSADRMYVGVEDLQYRRLYAVGRNSSGLKVLHTDTETVTTVPYGWDDTDHPGSGFNRLNLSVFSTKIIGYDVYSDTVTQIDRASLTVLSSLTSSTQITSGSSYIVGGAYFSEVGGEIWVLPHQSAFINIGVYNSDLTIYSGSINLVPYSSVFQSSQYWRYGYYDQTNNKYYIAEWGSNTLIVIDVATKSVVSTHNFTNRQGKTKTVLYAVTDPITNDLFFSGIFATGSNDAGIKVTYRVDRTTYQVQDIYPNTSVSNFSRISSSNVMYGCYPGLFIWSSPNTGYATDGIVTKFVR